MSHLFFLYAALYKPLTSNVWRCLRLPNIKTIRSQNHTSAAQGRWTQPHLRVHTHTHKHTLLLTHSAPALHQNPLLMRSPINKCRFASMNKHNNLPACVWVIGYFQGHISDLWLVIIAICPKLVRMDFWVSVSECQRQNHFDCFAFQIFVLTGCEWRSII